MKVLVCGDREWTDKAMIRTTLMDEVLKHREPNDVVIIEGEARGADTLAREVALELGLTVERYPADWKRFGKRAGPLRNLQMIAEGEPDIVWAFHDDIENSKGTKNMITQARRSGIPVRLFSHRFLNGVSA